MKLTNVDDLLLHASTNPRLIEAQIIDYIMTLRKDGVAFTTIQFFIAPILTFYSLNDVVLNRRKITRYFGEYKRVVKDRAYTTEEIHRALQTADERMRMIILLLCSTGCRIGSLPSITLGNLTKLDYDMYKIIIYEGTNNEYYTFCTPEAGQAVDDYLAYRQRCGEKLSFEESSRKWEPTDIPLIRQQFDVNDLLQVSNPQPMDLNAIRKEMVLFDYKPWEDVARLLYGGASVAQRFLTYGNYVLDNRPTGAPITISPDTDQLIDPTTYLILKNAYYNKATRAYADEWAINLIKQQVIREDWQKFDFMLLPTTPTIYRLDEVRAGYDVDLGPNPTDEQLTKKAAANTQLNSNLGTYTNFANLLQTTAVALPAGFRTMNNGTGTDVLPFGVTLFADTLNDCELLDLAECYETELAKE
jgi:hypothetical protein